MEAVEVISWVLGGFGVVLLAFAGAILRLITQTAVLQKTVDQIVTKFDLFLKAEKDAFEDIVTQNTQALKDLAK